MSEPERIQRLEELDIAEEWQDAVQEVQAGDELDV